MSKINYQELREAAEQATQDEWVAYILPGHNGIYPARTSEGRHCGYFIDWPGIDGQRNAGANARYIAAIPPKIAGDAQLSTPCTDSIINSIATGIRINGGE